MDVKSIIIVGFLVLLVTAGAFAFIGNGEGKMMQNKNFDPAMKEQRMEMREEKMALKEDLKAAVEANDFEAWKQIKEDNNMMKKLDVITEENFGKLVEIHEAMEAGDIEKAKELREELGLKGFGKERKFRKGMRKGNRGCSCNCSVQ